MFSELATTAPSWMVLGVEQSHLWSIVSTCAAWVHHREVCFHSKYGAQFTGPMSMGKLGKSSRAEYTYEAWFRCPWEAKFRRELFGGSTAGK